MILTKMFCLENTCIGFRLSLSSTNRFSSDSLCRCEHYLLSRNLLKKHANSIQNVNERTYDIKDTKITS